MLIFDPPKPDVFLATRNQSISFDRTELDGQNVEVTDLFGQEDWLPGSFNFTDVENEDSLPFVGVEANHCQVLLVAQTDLLDLLVGTLETTYAFMIYPYSH